MRTIKELSQVIIIIIILTFCATYYMIFSEINYDLIGLTFLSIGIIIFTNILAKKATAYYYETTMSTKIWEFQRYGIKPDRKFKTPLPFGIILPFILAIVTAGNFLWMAVLQFDIYSTPARASKRHGIYRFTEATEFHMGLVALSGVIANLILAIIAYTAGFTLLSKLSIYYAFFSIIPFSSLDGTKILFGKKEIWVVISVICLIFLLASFTLI